jgi:hypothetical protein
MTARVTLEAGDDLDDTWHADEDWFGDGDVPYEEEPFFQHQEEATHDFINFKPSEFTAFAFWLPRPVKTPDGSTTMSLDRFSFDGRRHMYRLYDTPAKRVQLFTSRQCEKSTLLCNGALTYMALIPDYKVLYVSPSASQTKTFSNDRIKTSIETSPVLKQFTSRNLSLNIFEKRFINRSHMMLRYAFLNADRVRGTSAYDLRMDEYQDILPDSVPVIEQSLSHAPQELKRITIAGTPKSLDNHHEYIRANASTAAEWVVPCDACGLKGARHWNILGERNIGRKGLICDKCGKLLNPGHPDAQWAAQYKWDERKAPWESYRITQLMVPWVDWQKDILYHYNHDERSLFYNEVLGLSYDSGMRPLTKAQLTQYCRDEVSMFDVEKYRATGYGQDIYMGIDWGGGSEHSYTVVTMGTYVDNKFRIFFAYRFVGEDMESDRQIAKIIELIRYFNVKLVGADFGGGLHMNYHLMKTFGRNRVRMLQYQARSNNGKVYLNKKMRPSRWMVSRTELMSDVFNAIKSGKLEFPRIEEWWEPYGQDMTNIFSEYNEKLRMLQYSHGPTNPDDTFHSILYCLTASMFVRRRPDIVAADKEGRDGFLESRVMAAIDQG